MRELPPAQKVHVRLLKPHIREMEEAFEDEGQMKTYKVKSEFGFSGKLYIATPKTTVPKWFEFIQNGMSEDLLTLNNRTNGAVLLLKKTGRIYAFTFGQGRHLIKAASFVPDFGIKVALNGLQHDSLRSLDTFTIEEQTIHKRTQASKLSGMGAFGVDVGRDILKSVVGTPNSDVPEIISGISGSQAVAAVSARVEFSGLGTLCDELLSLYRKRTYKQNFSWVDNIKIVRDPQLCDKLNLRLIDDLRKGDDCLSHIAPPEIVSWNDIHWFSYSRRSDLRDDDMQIRHYLSGCGDLSELTVKRLEHDKANAISGDGNLEDSWSIYKCLVFESSHDGKRFILSNGEWFEIDKDFAARVRSSLKSIKVTNGLPKVIRRSNGTFEAEKDYNKRVGREIRGMAVLDREMVKCQSAHTSIEACDLMSADGEMIHIKHRKGGSSSLSHLFAQARVSAESFVSDETYRKEIRKVLKRLNPSWERRVPESRPNMDNFPIVLGILGVNGNNFLEELPFFSQLNLVRTVEGLVSRRIPVSVTGIGVK